MTERQFYNRFKGVNCPAYRGAKMPPFNPSMVNETEFSDDLRPKSYCFGFTAGQNGEDDAVDIRWEAQIWDAIGVDGLIEEITRCLKHIGFIGHVKFYAYERGRKGNSNYETHRTFDVK